MAAAIGPLLLGQLLPLHRIRVTIGTRSLLRDRLLVLHVRYHRQELLHLNPLLRRSRGLRRLQHRRNRDLHHQQVILNLNNRRHLRPDLEVERIDHLLTQR